MKRSKEDIVFSKLVRTMAGHRCEYCKRTDRQLDSAHIFGRRHKNTRWDIDNAVSLCRYHHRNFTENPVFFFDWLDEYIGTEKLDSLRLKAHSIKKWKKAEKEEMYQGLKSKLAQYVD